MGYPAKARTDEKGHRLMGEFPGNMKTQPLVAKPRSPWSAAIGERKQGTLGDLLGAASRFHVLASYLVNEKGYLASQRCSYGCSGIIRSISIGGKEYRGDAYRIYERRHLATEEL